MPNDLIDLTDSHRAVVSEARALAASVEDVAMEADESSTLHPAIAEALRASGLGELMVPAEYGGRFEHVDPLAICLARQALMKTSAHLDALFALQGIGSYAISQAGTDEQRAEWLPRVASCEAIAALALTEPVAGSDLKGITTTATERHGELVIDGAKSFISNAGFAAFYTTLVKEDDGFSLVLVPAGSAGLTISPAPDIIAPAALAQAAARHWIASDQPGSVVNIASTAGLKGKALLSGYSASKGALVRLTEALAAEWARYRIRVNAIAPGAFETAAQAAVVGDPAILAARLRKIPARRMAAPDELGPLAAYLVSPLSDFVTGSCFVIDGGEVAKL